MTHRVHVRYRRPFARFAGAVRRAAEAALLHETDSPVEVTVVLTDTEGIRRLSRRYLGEDHATDVLSFPGGVLDPESGRTFLGDVVIAFPVAETQALAAGIAVEAELALLSVHGVLHLLGYDHATPEEKDHMGSIQRSVLRRLGVEAPNMAAEGEG